MTGVQRDRRVDRQMINMFVSILFAGRFRCGPASVAAIKEGLLCHQFDTGFCFAEVHKLEAVGHGFTAVFGII